MTPITPSLVVISVDGSRVFVKLEEKTVEGKQVRFKTKIK